MSEQMEQTSSGLFWISLIERIEFDYLPDHANPIPAAHTILVNDCLSRQIAKLSTDII